MLGSYAAAGLMCLDKVAILVRTRAVASHHRGIGRDENRSLLSDCGVQTQGRLELQSRSLAWPRSLIKVVVNTLRNVNMRAGCLRLSAMLWKQHGCVWCGVWPFAIPCSRLPWQNHMIASITSQIAILILLDLISLRAPLALRRFLYHLTQNRRPLTEHELDLPGWRSNATAFCVAVQKMPEEQIKSEESGFSTYGSRFPPAPKSIVQHC